MQGICKRETEWVKKREERRESGRNGTSKELGAFSLYHMAVVGPGTGVQKQCHVNDSTPAPMLVQMDVGLPAAAQASVTYPIDCAGMGN